MEEKILTSNHKLLASNRSTASLSGVLDVISFDLKEILLETEQGMLTIKGSDLHINRLSVEKGDVRSREAGCLSVFGYVPREGFRGISAGKTL